MLVLRWLRAHRRSAVWVRLDRADADPARILARLGETLGRRRARALPSLTAGSDPRVFAVRFFERFVGSLPARAVVVLDDCHAVPADEPVQAMIAQLVDLARPGRGVVLVSREPPPPPFARTLLERRLSQIAPAELVLTRRQVSALVSLRGLRGRVDLDDLMAWSEGWLAAVVLLLARPRPAPGARPRRARPSRSQPEDAFAYLASEVVSSFDDGTRRLLDAIVFLVDFDTAEAAAQTHAPPAPALRPADARLLLDRLEHRGFFVQRVGTERYRLHALLRAFLESELERRTPPDQLAERRRRAATCLASTGRVEAAFDLLERSAGPEEVAKFVVGAAPELWRTARWVTLASFCARCPEREDEPSWLGYWRAMASLVRDLASAQPRFSRAFDRFAAGRDHEGAARALCGWIQAVLHEGRSFAALDPILDRLAGTALDLDALSEPTRAELVAFALFALGYRGAAPDAARAMVGRAHQVLASATEPSLRLLVGGALLMFLLIEGEVDQAAALHATTRRLADAEGVTASRIAFDLAAARLALLQGDAPEARSIVRDGLRRLARAGLTFWKWSLLSTSAVIDIGDGDATAAAAAISEMAALAARGRPLDLGNHAYAAALAAYFAGRIDLARAHVAVALDAARELGFPMPTGLTLALAARVALAGGEMGEARAWVAEGLGDARIRGFARTLLLVVQAQIDLSAGERTRALPVLREALARMAKSGTVSLFCMHPDRELAELCVEALREGIERAHVRRMIQRRDLRPRTPPTSLPDWPWRVRVRVLGGLATEPAMPHGPKVPRMPRALLGALVVLGQGRGDRITAAALVDELWPDADGDRAARSLDVTLHRLRRLLGAAEAVVFRGGTIGLDPYVVSVDLWDLQSLLAHDVERALELYAGPLLPEVQLPLVVRERERLRQQVAAALRHAGPRKALALKSRLPLVDPKLLTASTHHPEDGQ